jgi:hypothetical protein
MFSGASEMDPYGLDFQRRPLILACDKALYETLFCRTE